MSARSVALVKPLTIVALAALFASSCDAARPTPVGVLGPLQEGDLKEDGARGVRGRSLHAASVEVVASTGPIATPSISAVAEATDAEGVAGGGGDHARKLANWFGGGSSSASSNDADTDVEGADVEGADAEGAEDGAGDENGGAAADEDAGGEDAADGAIEDAADEGGAGEDAAANDSGGDATPSTEFESHDHTDLYTVKRDRDRAWEQAKKGAAQGRDAAAQAAGIKINKAAHSARRSTGSGKNIEYGQWIQLGDNYAFVSKKPTGADGTYTTTAADDNLRAALGISKDSSDSDMLMKSLDQRKWQHASDHTYREKVCRGSKHDMPRWCKGPAGPGGRLAHDLDEAEQAWQEAAAKRQEAKMSLLGAHKAYLKEAAIQKEAMEYTKKALEAQEAVDAAAKMAAQRERSENDLLQQMEVAEQANWRALVSVRHTIVKYRTMSKEQVEEMEREEKMQMRQKEREDRVKAVNERNRVAGEARAQADAVERAKQKAKKAQEELKAALMAAAKIEAQANKVQGVGAGTSSVDTGDVEAAGGGGDERK